MVSSTSIRVRNTTNEETANNKSSFSKRRRPDSAYSSHQSIRDEEVSGEFYKGRSQEKTHLLRLDFFLLRSPLARARSVLTYRAMCSVAGPCDPAVWVFSTSGFHRLFATKPVSSETSKAERRSNLATIVLSGTRGP